MKLQHAAYKFKLLKMPLIKSSIKALLKMFLLERWKESYRKLKELAKSD